MKKNKIFNVRTIPQAENVINGVIFYEIEEHIKIENEIIKLKNNYKWLTISMIVLIILNLISLCLIV
jgi:hypothetical protein